MLEARRYDGYRGMTAPLTVSLGDDARGFNIPLNNYIYLMANGLLSRVRFWEQDMPSITMHIQVLTHSACMHAATLLPIHAL